MFKKPIPKQPEVQPRAGNVGVYTNKIHYLRKYLLDELATKKFSADFMEPVDPEALRVPEYYDVIRSPMDVGTIIKRVQNYYYHTASEVIHDVNLMIDNCFRFNNPGDDVYRNCQKLEIFFCRVLDKMPAGEEKPSTKHPLMSGRQHLNEIPIATVQRQCREQLNNLYASLAKSNDKSLSQYFYSKCATLSQKVDGQLYRSVEEFRNEVASIFKEFTNIVEKFRNKYAANWNESVEQTESDTKLSKEDINDVLYKLKMAESSVEHCQKEYSSEAEKRANNLIDAFDDAANKLKQKLSQGLDDDRMREKYTKKQMENDVHDEDSLDAQQGNSPNLNSNKSNDSSDEEIDQQQSTRLGINKNVDGFNTLPEVYSPPEMDYSDSPRPTNQDTNEQNKSKALPVFYWRQEMISPPPEQKALKKEEDNNIDQSKMDKASTLSPKAAFSISPKLPKAQTQPADAAAAEPSLLWHDLDFSSSDESS
ncbi:bromodomain testis-specific protein [Drosophila grimshawi]|uniref:GH14490 n=1 Tax=Drosophila grimshawi TaxID=7222 RepID=B4J014_DROGR|nr:bromodomain testis-specific protein [Drosophila grimshawi]EDV97807.1 GH14490 [Drosophila grimshawi]